MSLNKPTADLYAMLGLDVNGVLPVMAPTIAADGNSYRIIERDPRRRMHLRLQVRCRVCGLWYPVGRIAQHQGRRDHLHADGRKNVWRSWCTCGYTSRWFDAEAIAERDSSEHVLEMVHADPSRQHQCDVEPSDLNRRTS